MQTKPLSQITLFTMGRANLEKRLAKFYEDSSDADSTLQYLVAVLVRQCLCISDFSDFCGDLVQKILLFAEPSDVLRKLAPLFRASFKSGKEWEAVTRRLYKNKNEYHRYNNRVSDNKKYLFSATTPPEKMDGQYKIVSTFEDAVGKIHTWSLRDADSESSGMKIDAALELLSSLTIFEKDGIRRFVKLENSDIFNCTRYPKVRHGVVLETTDQNSVDMVAEAPSQTPAQQPAAFDFSNLSEAEKLALVKMLLPEGMVLTDARMTELGDEAKSESPATVAQKAEPNSAGSTSAVKEKPKNETKKPVEIPVHKKNSYSNYQKPKSEKQKKREEKDELMMKREKGKGGVGKKKDRKRNRRK